jgi:hypothetical protein
MSVRRSKATDCGKLNTLSSDMTWAICTAPIAQCDLVNESHNAT